MNKFLRLLPAIVVVLVIGSLVAYGFWPKPLEVDAVPVRRDTLQITVNEDGKTRVRERYIVSAPVYGSIFRITLNEGDLVEGGETQLVEIQARDPELLDARAEAEARARVHAAEASVQQAEARRIRAVEAHELADHHLERASQLKKQSAAPQSELDEAEHGERMAAAEVRAAEFSVTVAKFELGLAKAGLIRSTTGADDMPPPENITVQAPADGMVLRVFREDARVVSPGTELLEIGDPRDLEMEIDVLSTDAVRIEPGDRVIVEHWGGPNTLEGEVVRIEPAAFLKVSALGVEEQRVNVVADFTSEPEFRQPLGDGYRIDTRIVVEEATNVLLVPTGSLFHIGDQWNVFRVLDGQAVLTPIDIGRSNGRLTEIVEGLDEGDLIIIHPSDELAHGTLVEVMAE